MITLTERQKEVVVGMADNGMKPYRVAKSIYMARTTVYHHITAIRRKTKLDPTDFYDLSKLVEIARESDG